MFSAYTGHLNTSIYNPVDITGPVNSTYAILNSVNLCNHRDFQNLGVNGARESDADDSQKYYVNRNQQTDFPLLLIIAMIGNDVCNGHAEDTIASMTTPTEFYASAMGALTYLVRLRINSIGYFIFIIHIWRYYSRTLIFWIIGLILLSIFCCM